MKYPNTKPQQGEEKTPQKYPSDNIDLQGPTRQIENQTDTPGENAAVNDPAMDHPLKSDQAPPDKRSQSQSQSR